MSAFIPALALHSDTASPMRKANPSVLFGCAVEPAELFTDDLGRACGEQP